MRDLWSEEGKYRAWLEVEIAICEGLAHYGYIPADAPALNSRDAPDSTPRESPSWNRRRATM
jgi:Adenylosuccinate lyase (EC 4.3.2.2)